MNLHIQPEERRNGLMEAFPDAFFSLGGWTRLGVVAVDLAAVEEPLLRELVADAYAEALPIKKPPRRRSR